MFAICVFRRFGLAVPISFVVIGCLLEVTLDKKHGGGYYSSHLWALGLNLLLTGIITAIISCIVNPPSTTSGGCARGWKRYERKFGTLSYGIIRRRYVLPHPVEPVLLGSHRSRHFVSWYGSYFVKIKVMELFRSSFFLQQVQDYYNAMLA